MSILSPLIDPLRSALGVARHEGAEAVEHSPLHATVALEEKLDHLARALHRTSESADRQVEVLDEVVRSLPALTERVTVLSGQVAAMNDRAQGLNQELDELVKVLEPLTDTERDVSRVSHLFHRHPHRDHPHAG